MQPLQDLADERAGAETGYVAVVIEAPFLVCRLVDDLLLQRRGGSTLPARESYNCGTDKWLYCTT